MDDLRIEIDKIYENAAKSVEQHMAVFKLSRDLDLIDVEIDLEDLAALKIEH